MISAESALFEKENIGEKPPVIVNREPISKNVSKKLQKSDNNKERNYEMLQRHLENWNKNLEKLRESFLRRWNSKIVAAGAIEDFDIVKTIGTGAFGTVVFAKKSGSEHPIGLKIMEKKVIIKNRQLVHIKNEVKILNSCRFIFLVNLEYFFQNNVYLFVGMQFINGGELFIHMKRLKRFDEELTKFYASQVVLALEYLHYNGIVHRDLKPENILVTGDGYVKLCDFGFCKKIDENRTYTSCGTPDYLAPEIILNKGHNYSVDWWSLGILIYEMSAGYPPFVANSQMKLYEKIVGGKFRFPSHFSKPIRELLNNLIVVDRSRRFGCLKNGAHDIKGHQFFSGYDWEAILTKSIQPSFKPKIDSIDDTRNFLVYPNNKLRENTLHEYTSAFADFNQSPSKISSNH